MAETAFAQGEPIWDEFDAEYDTTEYHSDWSYYSDGGFFSDEEQAGGDGKRELDPGGIASKEELVGAAREIKKGSEGSGGIGEKTVTGRVVGRPARKKRRLMVDDSGKVACEIVSAPAKVTATVIVPPATTPVKKKFAGENKINGVDKSIDLGKDPAETSPSTDATTSRASMKRKPSTDETAGSP